MEESEFMLHETISINAKKFWDNNDTKIILAVILLIFFGFSIFIAFNIKLGIVNDEITHFDFSKQFSTTLGIPPELPEAYRYGVYITQRPYLFYWINGRVINIANFFSPSLSEFQQLVILRTVNTFYGLGTILFCYLFAKELIKDKWWQLLPPFLLSNTIMFVFLSGGVSYDNLTNLLSMAGLFFLARVFNHRPFLTNSLAWIICIGLGTLTKYAVLPLGLAMTLTWFVFMLKNKNKIFPIKLKGTKSIVLSALMIIVIMGNLAIYGYNLVVYNSLLPSCEDLLTKEKCEFDYYRLRNEKYGLEGKLTILESIRLGYPNPLHYLFYWVIRIMNNTFGIGSHKSYQTMLRFVLHFILFFWTFSLAIVNKKKLSFKNISLILIFAFLFFTVFIMNYKSELNSGFAHFAIHGRYLFPVIGILYVMFTKAIMIIPQKAVRHSTLIFTLFTYLITGPLTFIYRYNAVFVDWFVK
jgi:hypothetical protein